MTRASSARSAASALKLSNNEVKQALATASADRLRYLLALAPMFRHFIHPDQLIQAGITLDDKKTPSSSSAAPQKSNDPKKGRTRMTEAAEDKLMLDAANSGESLLDVQTTRLTKQPANIKNGTMRPYQVEGLNFLIGLYERSLSGILADEMGLGKTLQTISMIGFLRQFKGINGPHIIIVPKSTLGNWMNEFKKWLPDCNAVRFHGSAEERKELTEKYLVNAEFDALVTTYEMCNKEVTALSKINWRYLVIDEAHRIKNENSLLSQVVRKFTCQSRLLITGTPLQNNLHELWALLNFLLPDVFSNSEDFDEWFSSVENDQHKDDEVRKKEIVGQLHAVLRPFLIRRLKSEVEKSLPPKKETVLFTPLSEMQLKLYRKILLKDVESINGSGGNRVRLLNILMQLRKCTNHPYLFEGVEDRTLDPFGEHLIKNSGKLEFLDRLLSRLKSGGHRVLIFSQMTRVLDILEDFCTMRRYGFCRIDGQTDGEWRDTQIADYNKPDSDKFIFLLSTRAGGLGINLATADTVILFDSDWNAQVDLQAMDRAHRIGQKKSVNVYRLITDDTIEVRMLRVAMAKLRLDTLVIQQGRLTEQKKNLNKSDLLDAIRFGADKFFKSDNNRLGEQDLDLILERGEQKTQEMNKEIEEMVGAGEGGLDAIDFSHDVEFKGVYDFKGVDYKGKGKSGSYYSLDIGKRTRVKNYDESNFFKDPVRSQTQADKKFQLMKFTKAPTLSDYMLVNVKRYKEILEIEKAAVEKFNEEAEKALKDSKETPKIPDTSSELLSPAIRSEKEAIFKAAMKKWNRRDFSGFIRGMEKNGRYRYSEIAAEIGGTKSISEVKEYAKRFWDVGPKLLDNWAKLQKTVADGEAKIKRRKEMEKALNIKVARYKDPWKELEIMYAGSKSKNFIEDEDRWLVCMTHRLGYGQWDDMKTEVRRSWQFRFDWYLKSRSPTELKRRVDVLIRLIEKENEEIKEKDRLAAKRKENARRREQAAKARAAAGGSNSSNKKRKTEQANMNAYFKTRPNSTPTGGNGNGGGLVSSGSGTMSLGAQRNSSGQGMAAQRTMPMYPAGYEPPMQQHAAPALYTNGTNNNNVSRVLNGASYSHGGATYSVNGMIQHSNGNTVSNSNNEVHRAGMLPAVAPIAMAYHTNGASTNPNNINNNNLHFSNNNNLHFSNNNNTTAPR